MVAKARFASVTVHLLLLALMITAVSLGAAEAAGVQLTASWVDNSNGAAATLLERRLASASGFAALADIPAGVTQYVDTSVGEGTRYCYRVLAHDTGGVSAYSDEVCATSSTATPLILSFTNPTSGTTVSGTAAVSLTAGGGSGYTYTIKVDGSTIYSGTNGSFTWNTATVANGSHTLAATVTDSQNRTATATQTVTVSNVVTPPPVAFTVTFTSPAGGATVSGTPTVALSTTAAGGQAKTFALPVDGTVLITQSEQGTTLSYTWDTTKVGNGPRTLTTTVTMAGQTATAALPVTVNNPPPPLAPLTASFTAPTGGATVGGVTTVGMISAGASGSSTFKLAVDGTVVSTQTVNGAAATYAWNTATVEMGARTLTLTITDAAARTATATLAVTVVRRVFGDFDGDGKTDYTVYRPSTGEWFAFTSAAGFHSLVFGSPASSGLGDTPVPADYDGDGRTDLGIYRKATGEWLIYGTDFGFRTLVFGAPASSGLDDIPVPADYDGDGKADLAIYRRATGEWLIYGTASGFRTVVFGAPGAAGLDDIPVPADYDGDGKTDLAIYRRATGEWLIYGTASGFRTVVFGSPAPNDFGDIPVPADYDGDGKTDLAIYRQATGEWYIFGSLSGFQTRAFGAPASARLGDVPMPGDFDGDGKTDLAVFRSTTSEWLVNRSVDGQTQTTTWGTTVDIPLPQIAR
ncbi:MAG TPA: FG-GAP-like repeat-containing protein [Candidatus Acidoferrum sp.]|nr:FG-GAP-like repeat-containing protein [Candidatus Acidoferrum sp.]